jgi:hypothetical protein
MCTVPERFDFSNRIQHTLHSFMTKSQVHIFIYVRAYVPILLLRSILCLNLIPSCFLLRLLLLLSVLPIFNILYKVKQNTLCGRHVCPFAVCQ